MLRLSDQEISELYAMICHYHNTYLAKEGVRLPKLRRGQEYTKDALTLVYLAYHYPDTRIVTKEELTAFIRLYVTPMSWMSSRHAIWVHRKAGLFSPAPGVTTPLSVYIQASICSRLWSVPTPALPQSGAAPAWMMTPGRRSSEPMAIAAPAAAVRRAHPIGIGKIRLYIFKRVIWTLLNL